MERTLAFLSKEIRWGRLAGVAVAAALLVMVVSSSSISLLNFLPLMIFSIGGIIVEGMAPRHPFWNALFFGLLGVVFLLVLLTLSALGTEQRLLTGSEVLATAFLDAVIIVQSLLGAWVGTTVRRFREMAKKKEGQGERKGKEPGPAKGKQPAPVRRKESGDRPAPGRRDRSAGQRKARRE